VFARAEIFAIPREDLRQPRGFRGEIELVARAVAEKKLRLIVELGVEAVGLEGLGRRTGQEPEAQFSA
jgi:hypothetical protein